MTKERILSGMRSSGTLHLGNLLGALQNWVQLQKDYEAFYFIADWHALTTGYADTAQIRTWVREIAIDYLSAGLDPDESVLFIQSQVPEHAELHLLLSMLTPLAWLERVPTFKEQQQELKDRDPQHLWVSGLSAVANRGHHYLQGRLGTGGRRSGVSRRAQP